MKTASLEQRTHQMAPGWRRLFGQTWDDDEEEVDEDDTDDEDEDEKYEKDDKIKAPTVNDEKDDHEYPSTERPELSEWPSTLISTAPTPTMEPPSSTEKASAVISEATPDPSPPNTFQTYYSESTFSKPTSTSTAYNNTMTSTLSKDMPVMTGFTPLSSVSTLPLSQAPPAPSPDAPRKEIDSETISKASAANSISASLILSTHTVIVAQTDMLGPIQATSLPISTTIQHDSGGLSTTAEHILVALGSIGAFIILLAATYFYFAMKGKNGLHILFGRQLKRGGEREWLGLHREEDSEYSKPPPQYSQTPMGSAYQTRPLDEKVDLARYPAQSSEPSPKFTPPTFQRQDSRFSNDMSPDNPATFRQMNPPVNRDLYNNSPQADSYGRQPPVYNSIGNSNTFYSSSSNYSSPENQGSYDSRQTSNMYNTNQIEANRLSTLSSLSSGFGDGLQIPEPIIAGAGTSATTKQNYLPPLNGGDARFSWVPSQPRDTIYSSASIETAPRFRTVNSWVAQQSNRIEESGLSSQDIPPMPAVPTPYRTFTQREN